MHACLALALALAAPALASPALASPAPSPARLGYEREIDPLVPRFNYVLSDDAISAQRNKFNVETKPRADELFVSDLLLESNTLQVRPPRVQSGEELVRRRRGYNLENVRVPARYPYLPVANFNRFRRWG